jgi:hypothetical protein
LQMAQKDAIVAATHNTGEVDLKVLNVALIAVPAGCGRAARRHSKARSPAAQAVKNIRRLLPAHGLGADVHRLAPPRLALSCRVDGACFSCLEAALVMGASGRAQKIGVRAIMMDVSSVAARATLAATSGPSEQTAGGQKSYGECDLSSCLCCGVLQ